VNTGSKVVTTYTYTNTYLYRYINTYNYNYNYTHLGEYGFEGGHHIHIHKYILI
jgi:hypothetical protein